MKKQGGFVLAALVIVMSACGGATSESSERTRNAAIDGASSTTCLSDPQWRQATDDSSRILLSFKVCDQADAILYDDGIWPKDVLTKRVEFIYSYGVITPIDVEIDAVRILSTDIDRSHQYWSGDVEWKRLYGEKIRVTVSASCADGGFCSQGDMSPKGGAVVVENIDGIGYSLVPTSDVRATMGFADPLQFELSEESRKLSTESEPSGSSNIPVLSRDDIFLQSQVGQALEKCSVVTVGRTCFIPTREELAQTFEVLGTQPDNPNGLLPGVEYLTSSFDGVNGKVWVRSSNGESQVALSGGSFMVVPWFTVSFFPKNPQFEVTQSWRDESVGDPTTNVGVDQPMGNGGDGGNGGDDSNGETVQNSVEPATTTAQNTSDVIAPAVVKADVSGEGLQRAVAITWDQATGQFDPEKYWLEINVTSLDDTQSLVKKSYDGSVVLQMTEYTVTVSAFHFADKTSYKAFITLRSKESGDVITGKPLEFTPNVEVLERTGLVQAPTDLRVKNIPLGLVLSWNSSHKSESAASPYEYQVEYGPVGREMASIIWECCSVTIPLTAFEEGVEYSFRVVERLVNNTLVVENGSASTPSNEIKVVPKRVVDRSVRDQELNDCDVDPTVTIDPSTGLTSKSQVTVTIAHPCLKDSVADYKEIRATIKNSSAGLSSDMCASSTPQNELCTLLESNSTSVKGVLPGGTTTIDVIVNFQYLPRKGDNYQRSIIRTSTLSFDVKDSGSCLTSDVSFSEKSVTLKCDEGFRLEIATINGLKIKKEAIASGKTMTLSQMNDGWNLIFMGVNSGFRQTGSAYLVCVGTCGTTKGEPALPYTVTSTGVAFDKSRLETSQCPQSRASTPLSEVQISAILLKKLKDGVYELPLEMSEMFFDPSQEFPLPMTDQILVIGVVVECPEAKNQPDTMSGLVNFAVVTSKGDDTSQNQNAGTEVGISTQLSDVDLLTNPRVMGNLEIPANSTQIALNVSATLIGEAVAIQVDDGPWVTTGIFGFTSVKVPKDATSVSFRTIRDGKTVIVTRPIVRVEEGISASLGVAKDMPTVSDGAVGERTEEPEDGSNLLVRLAIPVLVLLLGGFAAMQMKRMRKSQ